MTEKLNIIWAVTILLSSAVFFLSLIIFFIGIQHEKNKKTADSSFMTPLNKLVTGVFASMFIIFIVYNFTIEKSIVNAFFVACLHAVRVFLANEDVVILHAAVTTGLSQLDQYIMIYISIIYILAPVLLISAILSFFEDALLYFKFRVFSCNKIYIFSALTERAVALAEDIVNNSKEKNIILFTNVVNKDDEAVYSLYCRARAIKAINLKCNIEELPFTNKLLTHTTAMFLLNADESLNFKQGIALTEKYKALLQPNNNQPFKATLSIYVFSNGEEYGTILDFANTELKGYPLYIRRINEENVMINEMLLKRPLFFSAVNNEINALILGSGRIGTEALKAIASCGQLSGYSLKIKMLTNDENYESSFKLKCPELMTGEYNISISVIDVTTSQLTDELNKFKNVSYVVVALGDDALNITTAMQLRSFYQRQYYKSSNIENPLNAVPIINLLVEDENKSIQTAKLCYSAKVKYNLMPFGDISNLYKLNTIINSYVEKLACSLHCEYSDGRTDSDVIESYVRNEYNRRSSIAAVLYFKYQMFIVLQKVKGSAVFDEYDWLSDKPTQKMIDDYNAYLACDDVISEQKENTVNKRATELGIMLHYRWNAYIRALGYECAGLDEVEEYYNIISHHVHKLAKKHPCLVSWDELDKVSEYMSAKTGKNIDYKYVDKILINNLTAIYNRAEML